MRAIAVLCIIAGAVAGGAAAGTPDGVVDQVGQAARAIQAPSTPQPGAPTRTVDADPAHSGAPQPPRQAAQRGLRTGAGNACSAFDLLLDRPC